MMDTATALFAITAAEGTLALVCVGGITSCFFRNRKLRVRFADLKAERDHLKEFAGDASANIADLQLKLAEAKAAAGRWAGKYTEANSELRRFQAERDAAAAQRREHMRRIAAIGNRSPKRRRAREAA